MGNPLNPWPGAHLSGSLEPLTYSNLTLCDSVNTQAEVIVWVLVSKYAFQRIEKEGTTNMNRG